ncbi:galc, partial [Symbiodinium sp. CCMP2456]
LELNRATGDLAMIRFVGDHEPSGWCARPVSAIRLWLSMLCHGLSRAGSVWNAAQSRSSITPMPWTTS